MVRSPVLRATPAGQRLLNHVQQVQLLERDLVVEDQDIGLRRMREGDVAAVSWTA